MNQATTNLETIPKEPKNYQNYDNCFKHMFILLITIVYVVQNVIPLQEYHKNRINPL